MANEKIVSEFKIGDEVVYIPQHLLVGDKSEMIKEENLGVVTSINDRFVFVLYINKNGSQATLPNDLFFIKDRLDLQEILRDEFPLK